MTPEVREVLPIVAGLVLSITLLSDSAISQSGESDLERQYAAYERSLASANYDSARIFLGAYATSDLFLPMQAHALISQILPHKPLTADAVELATLAIERNTSERLEQYSAGMGNPVKVAQLYKDLHSQRGWALWKLERSDEAWEDLLKILAYRDAHQEPGEHGVVHISADDLLRLGIIASDIGEPDYGWTKITEGLLLEPAALERDPVYKTAIGDIIHSRLGEEATLDAVLLDLLESARKPVPEMSLVNLSNEPVAAQSPAQPTLVIFFSPICGSCQQELRALVSIRSQLLQAARLILVLNRPELQSRALQFLDKLGYERDRVAVLGQGSAYDYIPGEPATWIVDASGIIAYRHVGYRSGDEEQYYKELMAAY